MPQSYVYILRSVSYPKTYVGQSDHPDERLKQHNAGKVRSTRAFLPWDRIYLEPCATHADALIRERWFKSRHGRKKIAAMLKALQL
jgi:putative endonuclease